MKAIIAAGGSGTRLRPLTFSSNKHLLPIANKPLLLYPLEAIAKTGITEIGIIVNPNHDAIRDLLGDGHSYGVNITYIPQEKPLGLAHVVQIAQPFVQEEPFIFHLGDNIFTEGIMRPFTHFSNTQPDALLTMVVHEENYRLGVPYFDENGKLTKVVEKPQQPPNHYGIPGLYFFNHHVFEAFSGNDAIKPSARGELEITDLYTYLIDHGYRVETEEVDGRWMDPGKFDDMIEANSHMLSLINESQLLGEVDQYSIIHGHVTIGKGSRIINSQITGPVTIDEQTIIQDCKIGPNVSVGSNCKLEKTAIKDAIVMQDSTVVDISRPIESSLIGKNTEIIGNNSHVSLFIGDHCKVQLF